MYLMHRLAQNSTTRNELLARVDWLIVPMQNPDGYEWSRSNTRLWRQNRRQVQPNCIGVDLNRNNAYSWRPPTVAVSRN
jgi:murein tripeptide amidase MpaA